MKAITTITWDEAMRRGLGLRDEDLVGITAAELPAKLWAIAIEVAVRACVLDSDVPEPWIEGNA